MHTNLQSLLRPYILSIRVIEDARPLVLVVTSNPALAGAVRDFMRAHPGRGETVWMPSAAGALRRLSCAGVSLVVVDDTEEPATDTLASLRAFSPATRMILATESA